MYVYIHIILYIKYIYIYFLRRLGLTGKVLGRNPKGQSMQIMYGHSQYLIEQRVPTTKHLDCPFWHECETENLQELLLLLCYIVMLTTHVINFLSLPPGSQQFPKNVISKLIEKIRFWKSQFLYSKIRAPTWPQLFYGFPSKFPTLSYQTSLCWNLGNLSLDHISAITFNHQE